MEEKGTKYIKSKVKPKQRNYLNKKGLTTEEKKMAIKVLTKNHPLQGAAEQEHNSHHYNMANKKKKELPLTRKKKP